MLQRKQIFRLTCYLLILLLVGGKSFADILSNPPTSLSNLIVSGNLTLSNLSVNSGVVTNGSGVLSSVVAVTNGVYVSGTPPSFSATPQVTAIGVGRAAPSSGLSIISSGTLDWNSDTTFVREGPGIISNKSSLTNTGLIRQYTDAANTAWIGLGAFPGSISTTQPMAQVTSTVGGALPFTAGGLWIGSTYGTASLDTIRGSAAGTLDIGVSSVGIKRVYVDFTNTATVGPVTINKASGRVNLAAGGTSLVVTDSLVTADSHIVLNAASAPGNAAAVQLFAVPAAGSFTINAVPAVTNQTAIDFQVFNAS